VPFWLAFRGVNLLKAGTSEASGSQASTMVSFALDQRREIQAGGQTKFGNRRC